MKRTATIIIMCVVSVLSMHADAIGYTPRPITEIPDSLKPDPEDEDYAVDTVKRVPLNVANGQNVMDAVLENRYRGHNTSFNKSFWDHIYLQAGMGMEKILPAQNNYEFQPLTKVHGSIGKLLGRQHTLRANLAVGFGYQKFYDREMYRVEGGLDYLFNLTSFSKGYNPMRPLEIQWLLGVGYTASKMSSKNAQFAPFLKTGMQFSVYGGPYGRILLEPYIGVTKDNIDYSGTHNWREYDVFYGVNIAFAHFLSNSLSQEQRDKASIRAPWFFEASNGIAFNNSAKVSSSDRIGKEFSVGMGKWFSSAAALRATFFSSTTPYSHTIQAATATTPEYTQINNQVYSGGRIDGIFNPLGLRNDYDWDSKAGFNLVAGLGIAWMTRFGNATEHISVRTVSYNFGTQVWMKLSRDLRFFIEPRWTFINYNQPYSNVDWYKENNDRMFTLNFGLSMLLRSDRYRNDSIYNATPCIDTNRKILVGAAGGFPLIQTKGSHYKQSDNISTNWMVYGQYLLTRYHSFRLTAEYLSLSRSIYTGYRDVHSPEEGKVVSTTRHGLVNVSNGLLISTAAYHLNFTELLSGAASCHPVDVELFLGAGCATRLSENQSLYSGEILADGHSFESLNNFKSTNHFAMTLGSKVTFNATPRLGIVFVPTVYLISGLSLPGYSLPQAHSYVPLETLYFGLQYRF